MACLNAFYLNIFSLLEATVSAFIANVDNDKPAHPCTLLIICPVCYSVDNFSVTTLEITNGTVQI